MSKDKEIAGLEHRIEAAKVAITRGEDIRKLMGNKLFRDVILNLFCKEDCARYVQESGDPLLSADNRADALAMAQAAGHLRRWLDLGIRMADSEAGLLPQIQEELDAVRAEPEDENE